MKLNCLIYHDIYIGMFMCVYIYIYITCQSVSEAALAVYAKISWPRAQVLLTQLVPWQRRQEQLDTAGCWLLAV